MLEEPVSELDELLEDGVVVVPACPEVDEGVEPVVSEDVVLGAAVDPEDAGGVAVDGVDVAAAPSSAPVEALTSEVFGEAPSNVILQTAWLVAAEVINSIEIQEYCADDPAVLEVVGEDADPELAADVLP